MRYLTLVLAVAVLSLAVFPVFAQVVPDPGADGGAFFNQLVAAVASGDYRLVAILAAVGAVFLLRQFATRIPGAVGAFFKTKRGGALTALLGGVVTALAGLLIGKGPINVGLIVNGIVLGIGASGGWNVVKDLIWSDGPRPGLYPPPAP